MYANGEGVEQNDAEAARLYTLAADQWYAPAQYNLGLMYATGEGVTKDRSEAARLYRLAVDQGYAPAITGLKSLVKYKNITPTSNENRELTVGTNKDFSIASAVVGV